MITLYTAANCSACQEVQDRLESLCLAHKTAPLAAFDFRAAGLPQDTPPPILVDEGQVVYGKQAIRAHLEQLDSFRQQWQKHQADACYCDDEGNIE